jgi:hypothetical protein
MDLLFDIQSDATRNLLLLNVFQILKLITITLMYT